MKPVDVKPNTYIYSSKGINNKDLKFKIGHVVRISKFKNAFAIGRKKCLWLKELKILCRGHMLLMILM